MRKKRNLLYISCLVYIGTLAFLSVFAPWFATDKSKFVNEQYVNIALAPPFYKTQILEIKDAANQNTLDKRMVNRIVSQTTSSVDFVEDIPPKFRYDGWEESTSLRFNHKIVLQTKDKTYLLGTDGLGRSLWSRLLFGIRISMMVGLLAVILSAFIGVSMGIIAGMGSVRTDAFVMFLINSIWSIPTLLLVFIVLLAVGTGIWNVILAIGLTLWVEVARVVRGQVKKIRQENYLLYTKTAALPTKIIVRRYILPNIIGPLIIMLSSNFAIAILLEAGLSFLGFGVQPPAPSLGNILSENYGFAFSGNYALAIIPGILIMSVVFVFNVVANHLRDKFDVKMS